LLFPLLFTGNVGVSDNQFFGENIMSEDPKPQSALIPILVLIIIALLLFIIFRTGNHRDVTQSGTGTQTEQPDNPPHLLPNTTPTSAESQSEPVQPTEPVIVQSGEKVDRTMLADQGVQLTEPVAVDPSNLTHLKKSIEERMVYDSLLRWTMYGKVEDKKWAIRALLNMSYAAEARLIRTVEKNDGEEIIVLYDFQSINTLEILCDVESVKLDFMKQVRPYLAVGTGVTTTLLAPVFDGLVPGSGTVLRLSGSTFPLAADAFAEKLALRGYKGLSQLMESMKMSNKKGKVEIFGSTDSLQGKKVRITHRNGVVAEIEPVGCGLTEAERNLCANLGVLADYHVMPKLDAAIGEKWFVRADQFSNMLDPSMRGIPSGMLELKKKEAAGDFAQLEITGGHIELDSSDAKSSRIGRCTPRGMMRYNVKDGFVESASLKADVSVDRLSKKHLLFETSFKSTPTVDIEYECSKGTEKVLRIPEEWKNLKIDLLP
jgi:hypothetical protein